MASISSTSASSSSSSSTAQALTLGYSNSPLDSVQSAPTRAIGVPTGSLYYDSTLRVPGKASFGINVATNITERQISSGIHGQIQYVKQADRYGQQQFKSYKDVTGVDLDALESQLPGLTDPNTAIKGIKKLKYDITFPTDPTKKAPAKLGKKKEGEGLGYAVSSKYDVGNALKEGQQFAQSNLHLPVATGKSVYFPNGAVWMDIGQDNADAAVAEITRKIMNATAAEGAQQLMADTISEGLKTVETNYNLTQDQIMRNLVRVPQAAEAALQLGEVTTDKLQEITNREYFDSLSAYDPYWRDLVQSAETSDQNTQFLIEEFQKGNASAHAYAGALAESKLVADAKQLIEGNYPESVKRSILTNSFAANSLLKYRDKNKNTLTARDLGMVSDQLKATAPSAINNAMLYGSSAINLSNALSSASQASSAGLYSNIAGLAPSIIDVQSVFGSLYGGMLGATTTAAPSTLSLSANAGALGASIANTATTQMQNFADSWSSNLATAAAQQSAVNAQKEAAKKQKRAGIITGALAIGGAAIGGMAAAGVFSSAAAGAGAAGAAGAAGTTAATAAGTTAAAAGTAATASTSQIMLGSMLGMGIGSGLGSIAFGF